MNRAIIVGSAGQDGRILFDRLSREGCALLGIGRESVRCNTACAFTSVDITDPGQVKAAVAEWKPDAVYYLAAFHHSSQDHAGTDTLALFERSHAIHVRGLLHFLEAIAQLVPATRLFYAASSLVFGHPAAGLQDERTPLEPRCIYGITKAAGIHTCRLYRTTRGIPASVGILYNHESIHRQEQFVSRKIIRAAKEIAAGKRDRLVLGDLSARIDWGFAPDYVDAMVKITALPAAADFIIATGEAHSVREFVEIAFTHLGLDWRRHVTEDPSVLQRKRPQLIGNAVRLRAATGWKPSLTFEEMVHALIDAR